MGRAFTLIFIYFFFNSLLIAQKTTCPCHDCPGQIVDGVDGFEAIADGTFKSVQKFHINIFNVLDNDLASASQCVKSVKVRFKHEQVKDLEMYLFSPNGDSVQLIGPLVGGFNSTKNTLFNVTFLPTNSIVEPDENFFKAWDNDQDWAITGTRNGSYHPHIGNLEDFNKGSVNGTWTLLVNDSEPIGNDTGELLDFSVEFCNPAGLVCDPCEEEKEQGIPCVFQLEGSKEQITPIEFVCVDVVAQNVAFVKNMQWTISWDPSVVTYATIQNTNPNIPDFFNDNFAVDAANGKIQVAYELPATDTLGAVVADSSLLFQVCFTGAGEEGDSTFILFSDFSVTDIEETTLFTDATAGLVNLTVDLSADCKTAKQLCGKESISVESTKGPGFEKNEGGDCWGEMAETQSKWYQFDILEKGTFEFIIQPKAEAGFRYLLFKDGCAGEAVACFSGGNNDKTPIGVSDDGLASFGIDGKFSASISVDQGETYYLVVDNKGNNSVGFDIAFGGTCEIGDQSLQAIIETPPILNCEQDSIILNTEGTNLGTDFSYVWQVSEGNFTDTSNILAPVLDKAGTYTLRITDAATKCSNQATVTVTDDFEFPVADAGEDFTLSCTTPLHELDGSGSSLGVDFRYDWSSLNGVNFVSKIEPTNAQVNQPDTYILSVTNKTNSCTSTDSVHIMESMDIPTLTVENQAISCINNSVEVTAQSSPTVVNIEWKGDNLANPFIGTIFTTQQPGEYTVIATASNGCTKSVDLTIADDRQFPTTNAGDDFKLTCENPVFQLEADSSSKGSDFRYDWSTSNGHFVEGEALDELTPEVDSAGLYILKITDNSNGCEKKDSVLITKEFQLPIIQLTSKDLLTCEEETIIINASNSDSGAIYQYDWLVTAGGAIAEGKETYHPTVETGGSYALVITNTETGCTNKDSVFINVSQDRPNIKVQNQVISCTVPVVELQAASDTANVTWQWSTSQSSILESGATLEVDQPGEYTLTASAPNGCTETTMVTVSDDRLLPQLVVSNDSTLTCSIDGIALEAASSTPNTSFTWIAPNGDSSATAQFFATTAGDYIQLATAPNGCIKTDTVIIFNDENAPKAIIEVSAPFSCDSSFIVLNASINSSKGSNFIYEWTTTNEGSFSEDAIKTNLTTKVSSPGIYQLSILDTNNDCSAATTIEVKDTRQTVTAVINKPLEDTLTCIKPEILYTIATNAEIPSIRWNLENDLLSMTDSLLISEPGDYRLQIFDLSNNCSTNRRINIEIDTLPPIVEAGLDQEINCAIGQVSLDGTQSSQGNNFTYVWTDQSESPISNEMVVLVSKEGQYKLTTVNTKTGCRSQDTVTVNAALDTPKAIAGKDTIYCRGIENFELQIGSSTTSQGTNFTYEWMDETSTILGRDIFQTIFSEGSYNLKVTNTNNNCISYDTIKITERPRPNITVEGTGGINCRDNLITYIARSDLPNTILRWDGQDVIQDSILSATDALAGATYIAYGIDETSGCENQSIFITITPDRNPPIVNPGFNAILNCQDTIQLDGSASQKGAQYQYTWSTEDGNILGPTDSLLALADAPGEYVLSIFNTDNFCSNKDTLTITDNRIAPSIELESLQIVNCNTPIVQLGSDTFPNTPTLHYTWTDYDGNVLGEMPTLVGITEAGGFILTVIDSFNLCHTSDSILVLEKTDEPQISLAEESTLDCSNTTTLLSATSSIEGQYNWTTQDGTIIGGANTLNATVNSGGTYQLTIENIENGCTASESILVIDNQDRPQIDAGNPTFITCYNDTLVQLNGSLQSEETNLLLEWTSSIPDFTPIPDSLSITVNQPGTYYFKASNPTNNCIQIDSLEVGLNTATIPFSLPNTYPQIDCKMPSLEIGNASLPISDTIAYQWTTIDGTINGASDKPIIQVEAAGNYQLEVINILNGCASQQMVSIEAKGGLPTVDIGPNQLITCNTPTVLLGTETSSSGTNFSYEWTKDGASSFPNQREKNT